MSRKRNENGDAKRRTTVSTPLGVIATVVPMLVPIVEQFLRLATGEIPLPKSMPVRPLEQWLRFYRSSQRMNRVMIDALGLDLAGWDARAATICGDGPFELPLRMDPLRDFLGAAFERSTREDVSAAVARFCRTLESVFLVTVWLPAVMLYGAPPSLLLRRARQGDNDALQALLRLDKSVVLEPSIQQRWHEATRDRNSERVKATLAAMAGRPHRRFSSRSIRVTLAGGLVKLFERAGVRLTSRQVRHLFAEMTASGTLHEVHMPAGEALTKALQREKRAWESNGPSQAHRLDNTS
jgi:hypothetical protein